MSIKQIAAREGLSSSTVSLWVRDIALSDEDAAAIARRRAQQAAESYADHIDRRRERWRDEARRLWEQWHTQPLFLLGVGMYWGEGDKRNTRLAITNGGPNFIAAWARWCGTYAAGEQLTLEVNIHPDLSTDEVGGYWQQVVQPVTPVRVIPVRRWKRQDGAEIRLPHGVAKVFLSHGVEWHTKMLE